MKKFLNRHFQGLYWQQMFITTGMVLLTLALLGAAFFSLSYNYARGERNQELQAKAHVVAVYSRNFLDETQPLGSKDVLRLTGFAASVSDVNFLICATDGTVLLSTDESLDIARSYCGRDRYTLIENAGNTGFSHAVNQGIAIAKGEYMALFNNDAFAEPDWLAELIKTADADPKIFAVSSLMLRYYEPELADDAGDYVTILGFACKRGDGLKASRYTKPCRVFSACGGAALYRKSILDEIGVFDELFFAYYEDVDLSWRANNFGYRNVYCPTARCRHICGATTGAVRYNPFKSIQSGRNSILLPYKNQPILMLVLNFIPMLLGYLLKVLMFRLRGFGGDYAKGFREAWAALPKINKPKFKWRNLPNYVWVECSLIAGLFKYIVYRVQRALKIT